MIKKIIKLFTIIFIISIFSKEIISTKEKDNKLTLREIPTIPKIVNNESIQRFTKDSLLFNLPRVSPIIITKIAPLRFNIVGLTTEITKGVYLIQLNSMYPIETLQRTMFHELAHVLQFERGYLISRFGRVYWKGEESTWALPWNMRPWEIHAEKLTDELFQPNR
jgi:hypothetical protein